MLLPSENQGWGGRKKHLFRDSRQLPSRQNPPNLVTPLELWPAWYLLSISEPGPNNLYSGKKNVPFALCRAIWFHRHVMEVLRPLNNVALMSARSRARQPDLSHNIPALPSTPSSFWERVKRNRRRSLFPAAHSATLSRQRQKAVLQGQH